MVIILVRIGFAAFNAWIKTYPNPVDNVLRIAISNPIAIHDGGIQLTTIFGQEIQVRKLKTSNKQEIQFNLAGLAAGIYFLKGNVNGRSFNKVLVKN